MATRAFPQLPDVHTQAIPRLCYGAEDREAGLYPLDGQPKTVDEAVENNNGNFRRECPAIPRRRAEGSAGEVVDHFLPSRGACQTIADEQTKTFGLAPSGQLRTVCLLTQDEEASLRKHPAGEGDSGKGSPCPSIRRMRKRGRRRVRRRRPNLLRSFYRDPDVHKEVTPVDSNCRLQVLRSKETPRNPGALRPRARMT